MNWRLRECRSRNNLELARRCGNISGRRCDLRDCENILDMAGESSFATRPRIQILAVPELVLSILEQSETFPSLGMPAFESLDAVQRLRPTSSVKELLQVDDRQSFKLGVIQNIHDNNPGHEKQFSRKFPRRTLTVSWYVGIHRAIVNLTLYSISPYPISAHLSYMSISTQILSKAAPHRKIESFASYAATRINATNSSLEDASAISC